MPEMKILEFLNNAVDDFLNKEKDVNLFVSKFRKPGTVEVDILPNQRGRVKVSGSHWPAKSYQDIRIVRGSEVRVVGMDNITLLVVPSDFVSLVEDG